MEDSKKDIERLRDDVFSYLGSMQEVIVLEAMNGYNKGEYIESVLNGVVYDSIYRVMEMIDGYTYLGRSVDLVDVKTGESIKNGTELHDLCYNYFKSH